VADFESLHVGPLAPGPVGSDPMSAAPTSADPVPTVGGRAGLEAVILRRRPVAYPTGPDRNSAKGFPVVVVRTSWPSQVLEFLFFFVLGIEYTATLTRGTASG